MKKHAAMLRSRLSAGIESADGIVRGLLLSSVRSSAQVLALNAVQPCPPPALPPGSGGQRDRKVSGSPRAAPAAPQSLVAEVAIWVTKWTVWGGEVDESSGHTGHAQFHLGRAPASAAATEIQSARTAMSGSFLGIFLLVLNAHVWLHSPTDCL